MATPINLAQPSIALPQSIIAKGLYPNFDGGPSDPAGSIGFIVTTAFDINSAREPQLLPANGSLMSITANVDLFSLLGSTYGGNGMINFSLPNLEGAAPLYLSSSGGGTQWGQTQGSPNTEVDLGSHQLPSTLGGWSSPIDFKQYGLGMQYVIQVDGMFPTGSSPALNTIGMVYPYASPSLGGVPNGFLPADGRLLKISEFPSLHAVLGTTYGGDGFSTFALPDLRDRVPVGVSSSGTDVRLGEKLGVSSTTLLTPNEPNGWTIDTMQPSLGMRYVISTDGSATGLSDNGVTPLLGQVMLYAGSHTPSGWSFAQGQLLSISENKALYELLGNTFGGDGSTTFALPDLQGRTVVGTGGPNNLQLGDVQGSAEEFISLNNFPEIVVPVPGVQLLNADGPVIGNKITSKFELDISGVWPEARVEFSMNGTTWSEDYEAEEGNNTLYVRQVAILNQLSQPSSPITFVLDTTAPEVPEVNLINLTLGNVVELAPMFKAAMPETPAIPSTPSTPADSDSIARTSTGKLSFGNVEDGAQLEFSIDGVQTWSDTFEAQAGLNQVQVRQVDTAGNVSPASDPIQFHWDGSDTDPALTSTTMHTTGGNLITVDQHGALATGLGTDGIDLLVHGHQQDVTLPSDIEHIRLTENGLNNTVTGNAQDNVFEVIVGNWVIEGADGQDTVKLANAMADYVITQESYEGQPQATLYGPEGRIVVRGVETIQFTDETLVKAQGSQLGELDGLYEEVLGRHPDIEGLSYWVGKMDDGASLTNVAQAFVESGEFQQRYGTLSADGFVEEMYESILDRMPDVDGERFWLENFSGSSSTPDDDDSFGMPDAQSQVVVTVDSEMVVSDPIDIDPDGRPDAEVLVVSPAVPAGAVVLTAGVAAITVAAGSLVAGLLSSPEYLQLVSQQGLSDGVFVMG